MQYIQYSAAAWPMQTWFTIRARGSTEKGDLRFVQLEFEYLFDGKNVIDVNHVSNHVSLSINVRRNKY
ncbi:hypothetical protein ACHAWT_005081 [Skeletonema menzelii]